MHAQEVGHMQGVNQHLQLPGHLCLPLPVRGPMEQAPSMRPVRMEVHPGQVAGLSRHAPTLKKEESTVSEGSG